ncbi:hypothetical protein IFM89_015371 [Coptis chinensis]|uniref:Uncharacterized protein n=1 Tax=Coptis chinensis TaxID=261450 RepID=A0A835M4Y9_9MAGN|nr:hypothetical protein IFM89_015371 [Coptis chinensis]
MKGASLVTPVFKRLEGKVALITGGASEIVENTARLYTQYDANVVIADNQDVLGQLLCKELGQDETISYIHCDVTKENEVKDAVNFTKSKYGTVDIMFSNAGIIAKSDSHRLSSDNTDFKNNVQLNK